MRPSDSSGWGRVRWALALAACLASGAPAAVAEEVESTGFGRKGFYVGVGASFAFPMGWSSDLTGRMQKSAQASAEANAEDVAVPPIQVEELVPVSIPTSGLDLDETRFGFGGVVGYRISPLAALEIEGEWLADAARSNFTITSSGDTGTAAVKELWTLTGNLRIYPFSGRFQPFGVFGAGLYHARVDVDVDAENLTTEALLSNGSVVEVPADFQIQAKPERLDGAIRVGLGTDAYLTEQVAAELKVDYVIPFSNTRFVNTDYLSLRVGLLYRF